MKAIDKATKYELKELNKQFDFLYKNYIIDWNEIQFKKQETITCKTKSKDWEHEQTFDLNNIDDLRMYYFYCSGFLFENGFYYNHKDTEYDFVNQIDRMSEVLIEFMNACDFKNGLIEVASNAIEHDYTMGQEDNEHN